MNLGLIQPHLGNKTLRNIFIIVVTTLVPIRGICITKDEWDGDAH